MSQEEWANAEESQEFFADIAGGMDYAELVGNSLGPLDILFGFLGISTAYGLARRGRARGKLEPPPAADG